MDLDSFDPVPGFPPVRPSLVLGWGLGLRSGIRRGRVFVKQGYREDVVKI